MSKTPLKNSSLVSTTPVKPPFTGVNDKASDPFFIINDDPVRYVSNLSDTEPVRYQNYQIPNLSNTEPIRYRTYEILEPIRYRTYQITNLSDNELIRYQTYHIPKLSDTMYQNYQIPNL